MPEMEFDGTTVENVSELQTTCGNDSSFHSRFRFTLLKITVFNMTKYSKMLLIAFGAVLLREISAPSSYAYFWAALITLCFY